MIRLAFADEAKVYAEEECGRYTVQVIKYFGEYCYRVILGNHKIRCWSDADENTFPKTAAKLGTEMVAAWKAGNGKKIVHESWL